MKIVKGLFIGLLIGLGAGVAISLLVLMLPLFGCTWELACGILSCNSDCLNNADSTMSSCSNVSEAFNYGATFLFSAIISTTVGIIWGIAVTAKETSEANAVKRAAAEKARLEREQRNKEEMTKLFNSSLNEISGLSGSLNDELRFNNYQGAYTVKDVINELSSTKNKTEKYLDTLLKENNESGGQK